MDPERMLLMRGGGAFLFFPLLPMVVICAGLIGCPDPVPTEAAPVCLDGGVNPTCTPAYEPTYDAVFANTLRPTCAKSGVSCHAPTGKQGGLNFDDAESAYAVLSQSKLVAGKPECSILVHRIIATDGTVRMPPGRSIPQGEQCAIIQWIANGAPR